MKIAVLGTGNVGGVLGARWAAAGHAVAFGARAPTSEKVQWLLAQAGRNARACGLAEAAADAECVALATPYDTAAEVLGQIHGCADKILIDCTNPLLPDLSGLSVGGDTSAAEQIARLAPRARVVKAFNMVSAAVMADPRFPTGAATLFYAGDDPQAKAIVAGLAEELGFAPVDAGPLTNARHLESLAMLYIHLALRGGWGARCAFHMLRRDQESKSAK